MKRWIVISTVALLAGCGGGTESVSYIGNTLVVDGAPYHADGKPPHIVPGEILVVPKEGMREEVRKLVAQFGLSIVREERNYLIVKVPSGFEQQWVAAFGGQFAVDTAALSLLPT